LFFSVLPVLQRLLLNCDEMQGFLFSQAVPGDIFETRFLAPPGDGSYHAAQLGVGRRLM
jgi:hypothetical protein